jgi:hypothetical protein
MQAIPAFTPGGRLAYTVKPKMGNRAKRAVGIGLAVQVVLFQIFLLTKWSFLYFVLRVVFFLGLAAGLALLVHRLRKEKALGLVLLLVVLVRVPFYFHPGGMVTTSDNALDALAAAEIRDDRAAPFFLLGDLKHIGTIKQLWVAFLWDVAGRNAYLFYLLVQLVIFLGFLLACDAFLANSVPRRARLLLLALNFAFIEVVFDYSLSIRGAPYLEMAAFFLFGAALFDPAFEDPIRLGLSYFFIAFSIYIHPLAAVLAGSFGLAAAIHALAKKRFRLNLAAGAVGCAAGLFHWFYYLAFVPKPVALGGWEKVGLLPVRLIGHGWLPEYFRTLKTTFVNLFSFESARLAGLHLSGFLQGATLFLGTAAAVLGLAAVVGAAIVSVRSLGSVMRRRRPLGTELFPETFTLVLFGAVLTKIFLFFPPHTEPRHNFDAALLIVLAVFIAAGRLFRTRFRFSRKAIAAAVLGLMLTAPHAVLCYRQAIAKEKSYGELLSLLREKKIKVVDTDFILAYVIHYLSGRQIRATDLLGPFRVKDFYPEMRAEIDALPVARRTFVFFSERYPASDWHKRDSAYLKLHVQNRFRDLGIAFEVVHLPDYTVIIPLRGDSAY